MPGVAATKEGNGIVDTTHSEENQVLSLWRKERAEQGIFVKRKGGLSMSRGEPWGPWPDQRKPSVVGQCQTRQLEWKWEKRICQHVSVREPYLRKLPQGIPRGTSAYDDLSPFAPSTPASIDHSRVPGVWLMWALHLRSGFKS